MRRKIFAALFLIALLAASHTVEARKGGPRKRRHVKAVAKHLAKQLAKVQHQTSKKAAKITSTMSYSAAVGFCSEKIKAQGAQGFDLQHLRKVASSMSAITGLSYEQSLTACMAGHKKLTAASSKSLATKPNMSSKQLLALQQQKQPMLVHAQQQQQQQAQAQAQAQLLLAQQQQLQQQQQQQQPAEVQTVIEEEYIDYEEDDDTQQQQQQQQVMVVPQHQQQQTVNQQQLLQLQLAQQQQQQQAQKQLQQQQQQKPQTIEFYTDSQPLPHAGKRRQHLGL